MGKIRLAIIDLKDSVRIIDYSYKYSEKEL
jgi:hypothetical protein